MSGHRSWFREEDGVCVELHRRFAGIGTSDQEFWDALAGYTEPLPLGVMGVTARVPGLTARAMLVGLHAATHGPAGTALSDLERALERLPDDTWEEAAQLAERLRAQAAFAVGLAFVPAGARLVERLGIKPSVPTEVLINTAAPPTTAGWERLAAAAGFGGKLRFLVWKLAPPRDFMRVVDPIGRRGRSWLGVAYLVRPFRLAMHAPRGFRAWRSARRRAAEKETAWR